MTLKISDVFTPRSAEVNPVMYVSRPELETSLTRFLNRHTHTLIFGESGNGKSWLYKKVLADMEIPYVVANCANASRIESLTQEISQSIVGEGAVVKTGYEEEKFAKLTALVAEGSITHTGQFEISRDEPLLQAFKVFDERRKGKKIVVLDNLESIFESEKLMDELANIIILLDDIRYSVTGVQFLIVGTPNGVLEYFARTKNMESVANRISELQRVGGFSEAQVREIVRRGFEQLGFTVTTGHLNEIATHVYTVTLGVAQRVHEYCEALAYEIQKSDWRYTSALLAEADHAWLKQSLRASYQLIEGHLNARETTVARRNQVIYAISKITSHQFDSNSIDSIIRREFPGTVPKTNMGIGSILVELTDCDRPMLKRNPSTGEYFVADPLYIMCTRIMLYKDSEGRVAKRQFAR